MLTEIEARSEELSSLGTRGISTEAIEALLLDISLAMESVPFGDKAAFDRLEELRLFWANKLVHLNNYLSY